MLDVLGFITYLILIFLAVMTVCQLRENSMKYGIGGINAVFIFAAGSIIIPLFKLPILCSLIFIIAGPIVSVISLVYPNKIFNFIARLTLLFLFIDLSEEEILMRHTSKDDIRKYFKTFDDTDDDTDDMNKDGDTNQDDE